MLVNKQAPIGNPPPIPFAVESISGLILDHWYEKSFPVLPTPVCTSSKINKIFFLSHNFLKPSKHSFGTTLMPPSPKIGSIIIAAV